MRRFRMPDVVKRAIKETGVEQSEHTALTDDLVRASVRPRTPSRLVIATSGHRVRAREEERNEPMRRGFERTDRESFRLSAS